MGRGGMRMKKTVIIINGAGGAGKDTLCAIAARHYAVTSVSAVTASRKSLASALGRREG